MTDQSVRESNELVSVETHPVETHENRVIATDASIGTFPIPVAHRRIPVIGIVGGIGSGKSAVANWIAAHARVSVINADALGHEALQSTSVKEALLRRFGPSILGADGRIVRSALAEQVFGTDVDHLAARRDLERIVHPEIDRRIAEAVALAEDQGQEAVLLDAAVLLEAGWRTRCDLVVFIETPDATRLIRIRDNRGWSDAELHRREASQWSLTEKRREADLIVTNDLELEYAGRQFLDALQQRGWVNKLESRLKPMLPGLLSDTS